MILEQVKTKKDYADFLQFPEKLYTADEKWAPPLWADERAELVKLKNSVLRRSEHALFIVRSRGDVKGRIIVYIDPNYNRYHGSRTGFFGNFESIDSPEVFAALFSAAEAWLASRGMDTLRGPINPLAECWGFLYEGFDSPPVFMSPYNPPYYNSRIENIGYEKVKDLLVYEADDAKGYVLPDRFRRFKDRFLTRNPDLTVRPIDTGYLLRDAGNILHILNRAVAGNWGYVPVEKVEMEEIVSKLKPILDPDAILFVEDKGKPVGCCLGFPDLNIIIKKIDGRLFPFGFIRLLSGIKKVRHYRLWGLAVLPEYAGKGLDVILYTEICSRLQPKGIRLEANYILEDNYRIKNALEKLGMEQIKKYRIYEKPIG